MSNFADAVKFDILPYTWGEGLDIGCGDARPWDYFVGIDICGGTTSKGPNHLRDARKLEGYFAKGSQDFIFSSYLLNELDDWPTILKQWWDLIKDDGHLVLFLPVVEADKDKPEVKVCNPKMLVDAMFPLRPWQMVEARIVKGQFLQVYRKCDKPTDIVTRDPDKVCAVMKLGAHGDALWSSSVFAGLKEQGFHTILWTQETGEEVLRHDPHIDELIQFESRVPIGELGEMFRWMENKYRHCRILVECAEGTLLPSPTKIQYHFPHAMRHKLMNFNYLEMHHLKGEVPLIPRVKFYPNDEEKRWANDFRSSLLPYLVVLVPNGSSITKMWPYAGEFAKRLLEERKDVSIVMLGDERGTNFKDLEEHKRFLKIGLTWNVRKALTICQLANVVIGEETGLLNSVSCEPDIRKVVFLSHSSVENLTRDWPNTASLGGTAHCSPCHRLHYDDTYCKLDETTKAAPCQIAITVDDVMKAIEPIFKT